MVDGMITSSKTTSCISQPLPKYCPSRVTVTFAFIKFPLSHLFCPYCGPRYSSAPWNWNYTRAHKSNWCSRTNAKKKKKGRRLTSLGGIEPSSVLRFFRGIQGRNGRIILPPRRLLCIVFGLGFSETFSVSRSRVFMPGKSA
jgi:hypothetical protein